MAVGVGRGRKRNDQHRRRQRSREYQVWKLSLVREFVRRHGWESLTEGTVVAPGVNIFNWVRMKRDDYKKDRIPYWLVEECEAVPGWSWDPVRDRYVRDVDNLRRIVRKRGWSGITQDTEVDGVNVLLWCRNRRAAYRRGQLPEWLAVAVEGIPGWKWEPTEDRHRKMLAAVQKYAKRRGMAHFRQETRGPRGEPIGRWAALVRSKYRDNALPQWLVEELSRLPGWMWEPAREKQLHVIPVLRRFIARHGWEALRAKHIVEGIDLGQWCYRRRRRYEDGTLPTWMKRELEAIAGWRKWVRTSRRASRKQ